MSSGSEGLFISKNPPKLFMECDASASHFDARVDTSVISETYCLMR